MRLLVDTHAFLWASEGDRRLPQRVVSLLEAEENQVLLSIASAWEMCIKTGLGKLTLSKPVRELMEDAVARQGVVLLPIELPHVLRTASLPLHHRDPFDRLLAAQSLCEGIPLVSADPLLDQYGIERIW